MRHVQLITVRLLWLELLTAFVIILKGVKAVIIVISKLRSCRGVTRLGVGWDYEISDWEFTYADDRYKAWAGFFALGTYDVLIYEDKEMNSQHSIWIAGNMPYELIRAMVKY